MFNWKQGDVVRLKSGGPRMTVKDVYVIADGADVVKCQWFDGTELKSGDFTPPSLEPVRD